MSQFIKAIKFLVISYLLSIMCLSISYADHFEFSKPSTQNSMVFYGDVFTIDDEICEVGDEIAVYDNDGTICGHFVINTAGYFNITVFGEDSDMEGDQGANINEDLIFIVWDASADVEIVLDNSMFIQKKVFNQTAIETIPPKYLGNNVIRGMGIAAKSAPPPPTITGIFPNTSFLSGGGTLTITGTDFQNEAEVIIKSIIATNINTVSDTLITCDIPSQNEIGPVEIIVINPDDLSATTTLTYEYDPPTITEILPAEVTTEGLTVTIIGEYFREGAIVTISGITANTVFEDSTTIQCYIPPYTAEEQVEIILINNDDKQALSTVQYVFYPRIDDVSPIKGHIDGGTDVIITGAHFEDGLTLTMGDTIITNYEIQENQILFESPPYVTETIQDVDITVANPSGRSVMAEGAFTYKTLIAKFNVVSGTNGNAPFVAVLEDASIGDIDERFWHFGGEEPEWRDEPDTLNIEFASPGIYPITLQVISENGEDTSETVFINVDHYDVKIDFYTTSKIDGPPDLNVKFVSEATNAESLNITWNWDFGDGTTSDDAAPEHTYTVTGEYTVTLTAEIEGIDEPISVSKVNFINVVQRQVNGRIVDSDGNGLSDCNVELIVPGKPPIDQMLTDTSGYYTFVNLPSEEHIHLAVHPLPESEFFPTFTNEPLSTLNGDTENFEITLYKGMMIGKIKRLSEEVIAGVDISLFIDDEEYGHCLSNSEGDYSLTGLPEGSYRLSAWFEKTGTELFYSHGGMTSNYAESDMITITAAHKKLTPLNLDLILATGVTISGSVFNSNGEPVDGIHVNAWSEGLMTGGNATTNAEGRYTITGLTEVSEPEANTDNKYIVEIHPDGFPYQAYDHQNNPENATLVAPPASDINFMIESGLTIHGTVTVNEGPAENIEVGARSNKEMFEHFTLTDISGNYTLAGLPPANDYIVFAHAADYPVQFYNGEQDIDKATKIDLSYDNKDDIDFAMNKDNRISGRVIGTSFDPSVDTIWVHIWSSSTGTGGDVPTDIAGNYEVVGLDSEANDYIIFIIDPQFGQAYYKETGTVYSYQDLDFVEGVAQGVGVSEGRDITLQSDFYTVKGKVLINGQIAPGIQVEAWSESKGHWKSYISVSHLDKDGSNYELTGLIDEATYEINVISDKYILNKPSIVTINSNNVFNLDLSLVNPNRTISGIIYNLPIGNNAWISAFSESADFAEEVMVEGTGSDIAYMITGLKPAEDYVVHLHALDHPDILYNAKTSWFRANRVNVINESKSGINFTLSTDLGTISGKVNVPKDAEAGEEIWIDAFSETMQSSSAVMVMVTEACTNEAGCDYPYTIKGLKKSDDYVVVVNSDKYATLFYNNQSNFANVEYVDNTSENPVDIDFKISKGYYIDGQIKDTNNKGLSGVDVEAWSDSTNSWGLATSDEDGYFEIDGLNNASDFIVQALITDEPPFIYKKDANNTRDINFATKVPSVDSGTASVEIVIVTGYQIYGYVQNASGKGLQGIIVAAEAQMQNFENHTKTNSSGAFTIKGLPGNMNYNLVVEPGVTNSYIRQEKSVTIDDSNLQVNFMLTSGYQLSGLVRNSSSTPIAEAGVFLRSDVTGYEEWVATNSDGEYEFNGVPSGTDYDIMVETDEDYLTYIENDLIISNDRTMNISLESAAGNIRGYVYNDDRTTAIANVMIHIISEDKDFQRFDVTTNYKGYYEVNGLPSAIDYEVIAIPVSGSGYASESVTDNSPGDVVNFYLSSGGTISGSVQTSAGTKLESVLVSLSSSSLNIDNELTRTDSDGNYSFEALKSSSSSDYVVTVYPMDYGYPESERTGINIGETIDFNLTKGSLTTISGTLKDNNSAAPAENSVKVYIYTSNGQRVNDVYVGSDGSFEFTSLDAATTYVLRFMTRDRVTLNHFAKNDGSLAQTTPPETFSTGVSIDFTYDGTW